MNSSYSFPPDLQQWVDARLSAGVYKSPDDLLRDAMQALDDLDQEKLRLFQEGNRVAIEQSRLGLSKQIDLDSIMQRVENRAANGGADE